MGAVSQGAVSQWCQLIPAFAEGPWVCRVPLRKQNRFASFSIFCVLLSEGYFCQELFCCSCLFMHKSLPWAVYAVGKAPGSGGIR